ncbi:MAG: putative DNA binding domain-containing protein [Anaerolineae bacterium]|nr:putative DNA binding domain-containing protein [Anaerolineae bacterium]
MSREIKRVVKPSSKIIVKPTPVVFIRNLIIIEFVWAVAAWLVSLQFSPTELYNDFQLARFGPFGIILTMVITTFQILIIAAAFLLWYTDTYEIDRETIVRRRGGLFGVSQVAPTQTLTEVDVSQSKLGETFNYGTLILTRVGAADQGYLHNIPNPRHYAALIKTLVDPQQLDIQAALQKSIPDHIAAGEGQHCEFKASFAWDYRRHSINKELHKAVMKNIVGFMNTTGGILLLGVGDDGEIVGLEQEFQSQGKPNADGFEINFNSTFRAMIGPEYRPYVSLDFVQIDEKTICRVMVLPTPEPVYLTHKNQEEFYIRTGNASQPLTISQTVTYVQTHFKA